MKTKEQSAEETKKQLINNLQELLVTNYDANKGFKKAIVEATVSELKEYFKVQAFTHHRFATQLDKVIHSLNQTPLDEGSTMGRFHRIWMDVVTAFSGNEDQTILEECTRGQNATMNVYREKLRKHKFPVEIKEIIKIQLVELELNSERVKGIDDLK